MVADSLTPTESTASLAVTLKHTALVLPLLLFYFYNFRSHSSGPIIKIQNGIIQGVDRLSRDGNPFVEFLGIPYAAPPIGDLRFEVPLPALNWDENQIRPATEYGPRCLQIEYFTSKLMGKEDCLYLNVFTPKLPLGNANEEILQKTLKLMPVMLFIHGGYFMSGGSDSFPPNYFMENGLNTVLVTINYRVASLGFLNTGDNVVRGNMGLKDQNMALRWVQANIHHFGGDKDRVTIFGNSAGASAVHYHTLSPMSKGLFAKAISQSGSAIKPWSFVHKPKEQAMILGEKLDCPTQNSSTLVACLKGIDANQIIMTHLAYTNILLDPLVMFAPSIETFHDENTFLAKHPYEILRNGEQTDVPLMSGLNSDEGLLFTARIIRNAGLIDQLNEEWEITAPKLLSYSEHPNKTDISARVRGFYLGQQSIIRFSESFQNFTNMLSDRLYFTASKEVAMLHSQKSPVYMYYYVYQAQFSFANMLSVSGKLPAMAEMIFNVVSKWVNRVILGRNEPGLGVCHGDETLLLFDMGYLFNVKPGETDYKMSQALVKLWTDFAATSYGSELKFQDTIWSPWHATGLTTEAPGYLPMSYLKIDSKAEMIKEPFTERTDFWNNLGLI